MFQPYGFQGGTATLEGQAPGMNGQSRIPENNVGAIPTTGIPGVNYGTPTAFNPIGQIPVQTTGVYNPTFGTIGVNPYVCNTPTTFGIPSYYPTPIVNTPWGCNVNSFTGYGQVPTVNPFVTAPINTFGMGVNGFGIPAFGTPNTFGFNTPITSPYAFNPYVNTPNWVSHPFSSVIPTFNQAIGFNGFTQAGFPYVNTIPHMFSSPVGLWGGQPNPFCFPNNLHNTIPNLATPFNTFGAANFSTVNPFFASNVGTPTSFVNPSFNTVNNPWLNNWNSYNGFPVNAFNPGIPFGTFNPAWNLAAAYGTNPVSTPWNNVVNTPWLFNRTPNVFGHSMNTFAGWNTTPFINSGYCTTPSAYSPTCCN